MKNWKGWASTSGTVYPTEDDLINARPVIVIDASKFPEDAPEIGSEWTDDAGDHHKVEGVPALVCGEWFVLTACSVDGDDAFPFKASLASLKPIPEEPKTAKGEIVATVLVEDGAIKSFTLPDDGTYDIIKRGDK